VIRPFTDPNPPPVKQQSYRFAKGTTMVLKEEVVQTFNSEGKKADMVSEQVVADAMQLD
jgi:hypothetical protein